MSMQDDESKVQELVIIRRGGNGEEGGHHGGVWKIAYADFMTAMMAFFLVMWLINSTDKKTLTQVATYFNPLRLTDKSANSRGVHQMDATTVGTENQPGNSPVQGEKPKRDALVEGKARYNDEALFADPLGVLNKIAKDADIRPEHVASEHGGPDARGAPTEGARDPFDPAFRREIEPERRQGGRREGRPVAGDVPPVAKTAPGRAGEQAAGLPGAAPAGETHPGESQSVQTQPAGAGQTPGAGLGPVQPQAETQPKAGGPSAEQLKAERAVQPKAGGAGAQDKADQSVQLKAEAEMRAEAAQLEAEIKKAMSALGSIPNIEVQVTPEGILISLTDDYEFGMFAIASAEPRPATVVVMEKLGRVLAGQPEPLVVRGHTDGRPYKKGAYDNWRLSTARAHMAYYMLLRGGIPDKRFERIEGYADHNLRVAHDPEAAPNRRIEILLKKARP